MKLKDELEKVSSRTGAELDKIRGDTKEMFERENRFDWITVLTIFAIVVAITFPSMLVKEFPTTCLAQFRKSLRRNVSKIARNIASQVPENVAQLAAPYIRQLLFALQSTQKDSAISLKKGLRTMHNELETTFWRVELRSTYKHPSVPFFFGGRGGGEG